MANFFVDISEVEKRFNINFREYFKDSLAELKEFEDVELIKVSDSKIEVSPTGTMLIRNIAMVFDAYMYKYYNSKKSFSKTV